jgi:hypothetical protein
MSVEKKVALNRSQETVQVASPERIQQARSNGPHGSQIDSRGNNNAKPKKHPKTDGGKPGTNLS